MLALSCLWAKHLCPFLVLPQDVLNARKSNVKSVARVLCYPHADHLFEDGR